MTVHQLIYRLTYFSTVRADLRASDVEELVDRAQAANAAAGITGVLLYNGLNFLQTLEGRRADIEALMTRITTDPRHSGLVTVAEGSAAGRLFSSWSLGLATTEGMLPAESLVRETGAGNYEVPASLPADLGALYRGFADLAR